MSRRSYSSIFLLYLLYLLPSIVSDVNLPSDLILLNCGASSTKTSGDGRKWDADVQSKFLSSNSINSTSALEPQQGNSVSQVPYNTARVIFSSVTYVFPLSSGPKFVRLYFYPSTYFNFSPSESFFSVKANDYTLLRNFSAFLTVSAVQPPVGSLIKEFIVTVWDNQFLNLTFSPSPGSFAFINGIEIVSIPNNLYARGEDNPLTYVGTDYFFNLENSTSLETVYRLNVGGSDISGLNDTGLYRIWLDDSDYIFGQQYGVTPLPSNVPIRYTKNTPPYTAPELVYITFRTMGPNPWVNMNYNLTWNFSVDAGFNYLVRLHFCETRMEVTKINQVVFHVLINNQTAEHDVDVINLSGGKGIPTYRDYIVWVPEGIKSLWLALAPNLEKKHAYNDAFLNGLEIFKLNNSDGNLAGPNPGPLVSQPQEKHSVSGDRTTEIHTWRVIVIIGAVCGFTFSLLCAVCFFVSRKKGKVKDFDETRTKTSGIPFSYASGSIASKSLVSGLPSNLCRQFSIFEIEVATSCFVEDHVIGSGGFGKVYKGYIDDGLTPVAIKRLHSSSKQGLREFKTEINMLSMLRHVNLVALIGYCDDQHEMILVYEYVSRGTLRDHLYSTKNSPLRWKQRLQICIGAAKGLNYLHTREEQIIHRDVKSTNILLDENWMAKVSDFGLSRTGPTSVFQSHVSTAVKGSYGYVDPEYYRRRQLTAKSDVYSFGVVLLEVLCARPCIIPGLSRQEVNLADWARRCHQRGVIDQIVDPHLRVDTAPASLKKFVDIAYACVSDKWAQRPTMSDVVGGLELALDLQLQEVMRRRSGERK
ncbi:hypothetical protein K2173_025926 [Erythroxylum novogranatense]|uniref:Protein kinase domain-containing protein n=1 Tax=Erythroxylum novogranatense TaxID=1862640 RepID=A0AAV8SHK5_9ROSI|nr:hypothetical protein K2173_025926 [Erythroxylum novogranatense]